MPDKGKRGPSQQKLVKPRRGQKVQAIRSGSGTGRSSSVDGTEIKPRRWGLDPINHGRAADSAKMPQATKGLSDAEGESHALYNCSNTWRSVAARVGDRIHRRIFYSHPAGHCRCHGGDQPHSREKIGIVQLHEKRFSVRQPIGNSPPTVGAG